MFKDFFSLIQKIIGHGFISGLKSMCEEFGLLRVYHEHVLLWDSPISVRWTPVEIFCSRVKPTRTWCDKPDRFYQHINAYFSACYNARGLLLFLYLAFLFHLECSKIVCTELIYEYIKVPIDQPNCINENNVL